MRGAGGSARGAGEVVRLRGRDVRGPEMRRLLKGVGWLKWKRYSFISAKFGHVVECHGE